MGRRDGCDIIRSALHDPAEAEEKGPRRRRRGVGLKDFPPRARHCRVASLPAMRKNWSLTQESFDRLLAWLGPGPEEAGRRYEEIRRSLIKIFTCRGCHEPEDMADETINRVVASLWKVEDEATAELMKHFYEGMFRRGLAPAAALRQAQLAMWRQKRWRAPYYWAAFVIQGQYGELKGVRTSTDAYASWGLAAWGGGTAAISFAALCAMRLRRRRRSLAGVGTAKA